MSTPDELVGLALRARRSEILAEIATADAALAEFRVQRQGRTDDDEHDPDGAPVSGEWTRLTAVRHGASSDLVEVDHALDRWENGLYGICEICGRQIPVGRLEARPAATVCVSCATR